MRLIDADNLGIGLCNPDLMLDRAYAAGWNGVIRIINDAPTIGWTDAKTEKPPDGEIVIARVRLRSGRMAPYVDRLEHNGTWSLQGWIYERAPIVHSWMKVPE